MDGQTLAQKVFDRDDGKDSMAEVRMLLIDKSGDRRPRTLTTATKDYGKLSKSLIRFTSPADIKDTGFLTWENEDRDDDQFLYLPSLRRVRRIVSRQKDNRFVNSDYTYEDMQKRKVDKDNHQILGSEKYKDYDCWLLEGTARDPDDSQYGKRKSWIIKDTYVVAQIEYYNKKGELIKVFSAHDIQKIDGIYTVMETEMRDLEKRHRTFMKIDSIQYNRGVPDKFFTTRYLEDPY